MEERELLRRLARQSKIALLVTEIRAASLSTSELVAVLDLLVAGPNEKTAVARAAIQALSAEGLPPGRLADLRVAFGLTDTARLPPLGASDQRPPHGDGRSQQDKIETRRLTLSFRKRFEGEEPAAPGGEEPKASPAALAAAGAGPLPDAPKASDIPAAPRSPLPVRGRAATILTKGFSAAGAPPPAAPPPASRPQLPDRGGARGR